MASPYSNVPKDATELIVPGTGRTIYFAPKSIISTCPALDSTPTTDAEYGGVLVGEFVMVDDEVDFFTEVEIVPESGEVKSELVGALGSKYFKNTGMFQIAGDTNAVRKMMRLMKNDDLIFIIPDSNCSGKNRVIGNCCIPANVEALEKTTGKSLSGGDFSGQTFTVVAYEALPAPLFAGTIPLPA